MSMFSFHVQVVHTPTGGGKADNLTAQRQAVVLPCWPAVAPWPAPAVREVVSDERQGDKAKGCNEQTGPVQDGRCKVDVIATYCCSIGCCGGSAAIDSRLV